MSTVSTSDLNAIAEAAFGGVSYSGEATYYAALIIGASTGLSGGTEVSGGSYARVAVTNNQTNFGSAASGVVLNDVAITWPQSSASWGSINCVRLYDASSGGNIKFGAIIDPTLTVDAGGITPSIPVGSLSFTVASSS